MRKELRSTAPDGTPAAETGLPLLAGVMPQQRMLARDAYLFRQGDRPRAVFRLVRGQVQLLRVTASGDTVPMHTVAPGELFAEASLFSPHYHCDAIATKESAILAYPRDEVVRQLKAHPDAMWNFAAEMARRMQGLRTQLEVRQIRSAPMRVLQALRLRSDASGRWVQDRPLKLLAQELGLTHEALYRALAKLEEEGAICRGDGEIRIAAGQAAGNRRR